MCAALYTAVLLPDVGGTNFYPYDIWGTRPTREETPNKALGQSVHLGDSSNALNSHNEPK